MNRHIGLGVITAFALIASADAQNVEIVMQSFVAVKKLDWADCTAATPPYSFATPIKSRCIQSRKLPETIGPKDVGFVFQLVSGISAPCRYSENNGKTCHISVLRICSPLYAVTPAVPNPPLATLSQCKKPIGPNHCSVCMTAEEPA